jgi:hypothetical protein
MNGEQMERAARGHNHGCASCALGFGQKDFDAGFYDVANNRDFRRRVVVRFGFGVLPLPIAGHTIGPNGNSSMCSHSCILAYSTEMAGTPTVYAV